jgi:hypothetical protein
VNLYEIFGLIKINGRDQASRRAVLATGSPFFGIILN